MSGIPTESRIFADRYLRETRRLEKQHAGLLTPGAENWTEALRDIAPRLSRIGSPIKRVAALRSQVVDVLNEIAATPEAIRHLGLRYRQASRSATFDFATFSADPNPIAGAGDEDGLSILMHRIRCDRRSVELITNIHIAYIARHAIGRLHERQRNLTGWKATAAFVLVGALGYLTRNSEAHADSALHLRLDDVLLVGSSKPAVKRASDGADYDNTLIDVRTTLSADEGCDPAALEQGRIATRVALEWLAQRGETRKLAEAIPPLAWRGGDFTSRVAVRA
jgi:hypothetical protein